LGRNTNEDLVVSRQYNANTEAVVAIQKMLDRSLRVVFVNTAIIMVMVRNMLRMSLHMLERDFLALLSFHGMRKASLRSNNGLQRDKHGKKDEEITSHAADSTRGP
jgi:hypothetical protein